MKKLLKITFLFLVIFSSQIAISQDAIYKITVDADPLVKQIQGRNLPGNAQVRVVLTGKKGEVLGGKLANGIIPSITIDEEDDIGKVIGVELTLNGIGWTKSVTVRNVKVRKTINDESRTYNFPCGCPLTQGNQSVYMDAGGALEFVADAETLKQEELEEFEFDGEFSSDDVSSSDFTISKRKIPTVKRNVGAAKEEKTKNRVCTTQEVSASASFSLNFLTNPTQNAIYPGALIYAEDLASGAYNNIKSGKDRAPIDISTSSAILDGIPARTVENPSLSKIRQAMNEIMVQNSRGDIDVQANFKIFEVDSKEELSLSMGGHFGNATVTASVNFDYDTNSERSLKVVKFAQIYYTMDVDQPSSPEDVFTNPKDAIEVLNSGKTPLYVSQVTYGRIAYFFMETKLDSESIGAAADVDVDTGNITAGGNLDLKKSMEKGQTEIQALIIGGDGSGGITAVNGFEGFMDMLREGGTLSKESLGIPVSYTLRFLSDNTIARTNIATNYTKRTCREVSDPMQEITMQIYSITSDGDDDHKYDINGKFITDIADSDNFTFNPKVKNLMYENLFSSDHPGKTSKTGGAKVDKKSKPFKIDTRKIDDYWLQLNFQITEHDPYVFNTSDTHSEIKRVRLKDVIAVDKQAALAPGGRRTVSVVVDRHTYELTYSVVME